MSYIIENISTKEVTTKFGPKPVYNIRANGEVFSYGFKKPTFAVSDEVDFQFTESTYGKNVDLASVRLITKGAGGTAPSTPAFPSASPVKAPYSPPSKVFPIPALHGDRAIVRQNSLTNAVNLLKTHFAADDMDDLNGAADFIISIARKFEAYSCGDLDAEAAAQMVAE